MILIDKKDKVHLEDAQRRKKNTCILLFENAVCYF